MKQEIKDFLTSKGVPWEEVSEGWVSLFVVWCCVCGVDVLYMTPATYACCCSPTLTHTFSHFLNVTLFNPHTIVLALVM